MPAPSELKRVAYHEAGHVVIAWYYNLCSVGVSITRKRGSVGAAKILGLFGKVPLQTHQIERELDIAMAGAAAEEILTGKKVTGWGGNDYINALKMAAQWSEQTGKKFDDIYFVDLNALVEGTSGCLFSGAFLDEFGTHVRQLMQRSHIWACVEAVANKLLKKSVLDCQQVTEIISKTWNEKKGDQKELVLEKQRSSNIQRPWGEWIQK